MGLITDDHLRVKNTSNIFALGDCATIQYTKMSDHVETLYNDAGIATDMTLEQFEGFKTFAFLKNKTNKLGILQPCVDVLLTF